MDYLQIMQGACAHDSDAIGEHDQRYRPWMMALAARFVRQDAEDVVQEVFIEVHTKKTTCKFLVEPEAAWRKYLVLTVRSRCIDWLRRFKRQREVYQAYYEESVLTDSEPSETHDATDELVSLVAECTATLPARVRQAFELRASGLSSEEVAQRMGIQVKKVYVYYSQAMKAIKDRVEGKAV